MSPPTVVFRDCTKRYGPNPAVRGLSFELRPGEITCLLGPNGAGKTTTIRMLAGMLMPSEGDIVVDGVSTGSPDIHAIRRGTGYVADQPVFDEYLTGREYVEFLALLYGTPNARAETITQRFDALQLGADADALIGGYSLGMRKKLALIGATIHDPRLLILDEPTGALDALAARAIKDQMADARARGSIVLFSTHVMEIAERIADRLLILNKGVLVWDGPLGDLRRARARASGATLEEIFLGITQGTQSPIHAAPQSASA